MTSAILHISSAPIERLISQSRRGSSALWFSAIAMVILALAGVALSQFDARLFNGISVWDKPAKFFLAVAVQFATVAFALGFIERSRSTSIAASVLLLSGWAENLYIAYRAALGEASHFNSTSAIASVAYALMGLGAVAMTATSGFIGWKVWRAKAGALLQEAAGFGLVAASVLGTVAGVAISIHGGHWVGGEMSDAHGLGFFSWSTTGGDLRVAHFVGLHLAQALPLAALSGSRHIVIAAAVLGAAAVAATFVMGLMGMPLFTA